VFCKDVNDKHINLANTLPRLQDMPKSAEKLFNACVQCDFPGCSRSFHAQCAAEEGLEASPSATPIGAFSVRCEIHRDDAVDDRTAEIVRASSGRLMKAEALLRQHAYLSRSVVNTSETTTKTESLNKPAVDVGAWASKASELAAAAAKAAATAQGDMGGTCRG
jgi:hypothetical protein